MVAFIVLKGGLLKNIMWYAFCIAVMNTFSLINYKIAFQLLVNFTLHLTSFGDHVSDIEFPISGYPSKQLIRVIVTY